MISVLGFLFAEHAEKIFVHVGQPLCLRQGGHKGRPYNGDRLSDHRLKNGNWVEKRSGPMRKA